MFVPEMTENFQYGTENGLFWFLFLLVLCFCEKGD